MSGGEVISFISEEMEIFELQQGGKGDTKVAIRFGYSQAGACSLQGLAADGVPAFIFGLVELVVGHLDHCIRKSF